MKGEDGGKRRERDNRKKEKIETEGGRERKTQTDRDRDIVKEQHTERAGETAKARAS